MPRPQPLTEREIRALAKAYETGHTVRSLARDRGWSYGFTYNNLLVAADKGFIVMRSRGQRGTRGQA